MIYELSGGFAGLVIDPSMDQFKILMSIFFIKIVSKHSTINSNSG